MEPALSQQYYVGQNGEQNGPYSEHEIVSQIQQGLVSEDAMVWHDGMPDWQPIKNFERFLEAFQGNAGGGAEIGGMIEDLMPDAFGAGPTATTDADDVAAAKEKKARLSKSGLKKLRHSEVSTFAFSDKEAKPIYKDSVILRTGKFLKRRFSIVLFGGILFAVAFGGYHLFISVINPEGDPSATEAPRKKGRFPKANPTAVTTTPASSAAATTNTSTSKPLLLVDNTVRLSELQKAKSDLLLSSDTAMRTIEKLVEQNPDDAVGKEALETGLSYYKTNQRRTDAGRLLLKARRPAEASKFFLEEPPAYSMADEALFAAYQQSRAADRADLLIQDIQILLGPLNRTDLARDRIKQLEKDFPRKRHPYGYYLKSIDGRIADIFNRLSFYFVQSLLQHVVVEFPAMSWVERPVVEILRMRDGKYRISGRYRGDVLLSRDKLKNVTFIFWMDGEQWKLIETDVTEDRTRFAAGEKQRLATRAVLATTMLENLETLFRTRFPKSRLHEAVSETADTAHGHGGD